MRPTTPVVCSVSAITDILAETGMTREYWDGLSDDEKTRIVDDNGFRRRGNIKLRSAGGHAMDGRILAAVEGKIALSGGTESGDVLTTAALHEQMHGVMRIMRDAAKAGNAEAKALVDAVAAKFKDVDPDEAEEKIADLFETYILRRNDVAPEDAPLIERLIDYIRKLFNTAETEARKRDDREMMATQFLRDLTHGATLDDAVANDEARTEQAAQGEVEAEESVRSSARRTRWISMTPQETARFMAAFRENEARFFKRGMEPLPWGALHTANYCYLYGRFSDGTFDIRNRWHIGSEDDNIYWQTRKDFNDAIDATPETSRSDNETLRGDGRGHSRNDTDRLGDGRAAMDDARLDGQSVRQGGQVSRNGKSSQHLREDSGRDASAGRDSAGGVERKSSLISSKGASRLGVGNLADAERMEKAGADRTVIWKKTGWWRGKDGKWRVEVPDLEFKKGWLKYANTRSFKIGDVFSGPVLTAYPQISDYEVVRSLDSPIVGVLATFDRSKNQIVIPDSLNLQSGDALDSITHELQHAIQDIEKLAPGTSPVGALYGLISADHRAKELSEKANRTSAEERELKFLSDNIRKAESFRYDKNSIVDYYYRASGEVEARIAEARRGMTAEQRAKTPPWMSLNYGAGNDDMQYD